MTAPTHVLLRVRYMPVPGTDAEYGQGAIEKNDLAHREVEPFVWLIEVEAPGDVAQWRGRLNAVVDPKHGAFSVERASPEDEDALRGGRITLQR
jgi:hypothetical protein